MFGKTRSQEENERLYNVENRPGLREPDEYEKWVRRSLSGDIPHDFYAIEGKEVSREEYDKHWDYASGETNLIKDVAK